MMFICLFDSFQAPQGHSVQQLVDANGTVRHIILTPDPMLSQQPPIPPQQGHPQGVPVTPYVSAHWHDLVMTKIFRET